MSWYFEVAGRDKETLKTAVAEEIGKAKQWHSGHEAIVEKFGEAIAGALDLQLQPEGLGFQVKSSGHVGSDGATGSFEIRRITVV
jgi:hypothetical protein